MVLLAEEIMGISQCRVSQFFCLDLSQGDHFILYIYLSSNFQCLLIHLRFQRGTLFGHEKGNAREHFFSLGLH